MKTSIVLCTALLVSTNLLAGETLETTSKAKQCKSYALGQKHIGGREARDRAAEVAGDLARKALSQLCEIGKKGHLHSVTAGRIACGRYEDRGDICFDQMVCVTCEVTATGICD